jgi:hypothetical protein
MRAVGYFAPGPITAPNSLLDIELPRPSATGRDLLVEVRAVSVNPVDESGRADAQRRDLLGNRLAICFCRYSHSGTSRLDYSDAHCGRWSCRHLEFWSCRSPFLN